MGCYFNTIDRKGLDGIELFVIQFGRKDPDPEESPAIRLID